MGACAPQTGTHFTLSATGYGQQADARNDTQTFWRALRRASITADALRYRVLNEAPAYALRINEAEKLARLSAHLDAITRLLDASGELGKRLDFLIQELHREANTLGSKSPALEQTNITVEMKVAIEQMREPV